MIIPNAKNIPLNALQGTVPDVSGALMDRFQQMTFGQIGKVINQIFQVQETVTNFSFLGNWQAAQPTNLEIMARGERSWTYWTVHTLSVLPLQTDDVITYLGTQYRVMSKTDFTLNGFVEYRFISDYSGSGP